MNVRKIDVNEFQKRKFERSFISVYVVIKSIVVETDDGIEPKNLCVFYGFTALGARKIIAIYFEDTKDNRFWLNIFEDLKSRNLKNIMFLVTPKNRNIERCAKIVYNNIEVVRSPEDIMNSIDIFFPTKTSRALEIQLKNLLLADNIEICKEKIELFKQEYLHNKLVLTVFEKQEEDIFKLYKFNVDIRKLLYQYYAIRDIKRQINKLNVLQPLCSDITSVATNFMQYITSFERGLSYSKKGWVQLMNILYDEYPKKWRNIFNMKKNKEEKINKKENNKRNIDKNDPRFMTPEQKQIVDLILSNNEIKTGKDVSVVFNELRGKVIQTLLEAEMDEFLGYNKNSHENKEDENRRNGYTSKSKKVKTDYGEITIRPPRDRKGEFEPKIVKKRQKVLEGFDDIAIAMYAKGMSLKDISDMIRQIYKVDLSIETISNLTSAVSKEVQLWQNRKLENFYPFVYIDCLYAPVKKDLISEKTAIYVMLGINKYGKKEVMGIWINENESATFWTSVFEEIKVRGVEDILFVSMDGLTGLSEAIEKIYPKTKTQRCIVHIVRNIYSILDKKKAKSIIQDFKQIYTASNINNAKLAYENFIEKYKDNKKLIKKVNDLIEHVFNIFEYPIEIRKIIYTTNPIESLNSCLRKVTRGKGAFISIEALLKVLYLRIKDLEKSWSKGTRNWNNVQNQLIELFGDRTLKYYT